MIKHVCLASLLACWFAAGVAIAQAPPIGQGGASPQPPFVMQRNHMVFGGPLVKTSGACGTAGAPFKMVNNGYDSGGFIAFGSDMQVGDVCRLSFSQPFTFANCVATSYAQNILSAFWNNAEIDFKLVAPIAPTTPALDQPAASYFCFDLRQQ